MDRRRRTRRIAAACLVAGSLLVGGCFAGETRQLRREAEQLYESGDLQGALEKYQQVLEQEPDDDLAHYDVGVVQYSLERYEEALASIDRAAALQPERADFLMLRGNTLIRLERHDEAIRDYEEALRLDPSQIEAYYSIGLAHYNKREYATAVTWLKRYLDSGPPADRRERVQGLIEFLEQ